MKIYFILMPFFPAKTDFKKLTPREDEFKKS